MWKKFWQIICGIERGYLVYSVISATGFTALFRFFDGVQWEIAVFIFFVAFGVSLFILDHLFGKPPQAKITISDSAIFIENCTNKPLFGCQIAVDYCSIYGLKRDFIRQDLYFPPKEICGPIYVAEIENNSVRIQVDSPVPTYAEQLDLGKDHVVIISLRHKKAMIAEFWCKIYDENGKVILIQL